MQLADTPPPQSATLGLHAIAVATGWRPKCRISIGTRTLEVTASTIWNDQSRPLDTFKSKLMTQYFTSTYSALLTQRLQFNLSDNVW